MNARLPLEAPVRESELARFAAIARIAAAKGAPSTFRTWLQSLPRRCAGSLVSSAKGAMRSASPSSTVRLSPSTLHREATMAEHSHENHPSGGGGYGRWAFWGFVLIAAYFLITEHWAHVFQYLPFLLLLACPLLHFFHGHGGHGGHGDKREQKKDDGSQ
jgi:Protein of unknown function (DUF2933)